MITPKPTDWREARRLQAYELRQKGWKQAHLAEALDVSEGAVSQWEGKLDQAAGDKTVLLHHPPPGPKMKLSLDQLVELPLLLLKGATRYGFNGDIWTGERVAWLIKFKYGVSYHPKHVCRLLKLLGSTPQMPVQKANGRDEQALERWKTECWPALKKRLGNRTGTAPS